MCKLCGGKLDYAYIEDGWLYIESEILYKAKEISFPISFCPWCGAKLTEKERMMPKVTPRDWKYQMQEQEAENYEEV